MAIIGALPVQLQNGTTADAPDVMADLNKIRDDTNTNAAQNGANSDITSLSGLTTPLSIPQGGTGAATAPAALLSLGVPIAGYLTGLKLGNNASDLTNDIDIAAGGATDSGAAAVMVLGSAYVKRTDASWAVGSAQGMWDSGVMANGWGYVFLIRRPDTGVVDVLGSASATAPTMPSNYTQKRRIGCIYRSGGALLSFVQNGDMFLWGSPADETATNPGTSRQTVFLFVPPTTGMMAYVNFIIYDDATGGQTTYAILSSPLNADIAPSSSVYSTLIPGGLARGNGFVTEMIPTNDASVCYRLSRSDADVDVRLVALGWMDPRGK